MTFKKRYKDTNFSFFSHKKHEKYFSAQNFQIFMSFFASKSHYCSVARALHTTGWRLGEAAAFLHYLSKSARPAAVAPNRSL
jgi:hypothetical protein